MCNSKTLFLITFLLLVQNSFTGSNLKHAETSNVKSSSPVPPKPESPQKLLENEYEKFLHSKQFQDDAKTEFTKLDTNKDGKLQFNEVSSTLSKFWTNINGQAPTSKQLQEFYDKNARTDKLIDFKEFIDLLREVSRKSYRKEANFATTKY